MYLDGTYREKNPGWHSIDSKWKAGKIAAILDRNHVDYTNCIEVGCGAGLVISNLAELKPGRKYSGFDVSPDAAALWRTIRGPGVQYYNADFLDHDIVADLLLLIDVFEHVDDYLGFLRKLSSKSHWFVFHIPLELHVSGLLRNRQLHSREQVGHLHYFSQATALATLMDTGYSIVDWQYTRLSQETSEGKTPATSVMNGLRAVIQCFSTDFAARLLGGYSLLVLCRKD